MKKTLAAASFSALLAVMASSTSSGFSSWNTKYWANENNFNRISSFNVSDNLPDGSKSTTKTSSEVVTASVFSYALNEKNISCCKFFSFTCSYGLLYK